MTSLMLIEVTLVVITGFILITSFVRYRNFPEEFLQRLIAVTGVIIPLLWGCGYIPLK